MDPGSTSGVAAVDFDGDLKLVKSGKNFPPSEIIQEVIDAGHPVVVTSDKAKMPSKVEKIASSLGAERFVPEEDLEARKKKELGEGENSHELDASASALNAYNNLQREIRKIDRYCDKLGEDRYSAAKKYFEGEPLTGTELEEPAPEESGKEDPEKHRLERREKELEKEVARLKSRIGELEKENSELEDRLEQGLEEERAEIIKEEEIQERENTIERKNREIDRLEDKLEKAEIREKQYRRALEKLESGGELVKKIDYSADSVPEKGVTRSEDLKERLEARGYNIRLQEEVEGLELGDYMVVDEFPKPKNFRKIIRDYKESR